MNLTADGVYALRSDTDTTVVYPSGNFGTAIVEVGYKNEVDDFVAFTGGQLSSGAQFKVEHGVGMALLVRLTGSDVNTNLFIETHAMN